MPARSRPPQVLVLAERDGLDGAGGEAWNAVPVSRNVRKTHPEIINPKGGVIA